jgi:hypothetical protein
MIVKHFKTYISKFKRNELAATGKKLQLNVPVIVRAFFRKYDYQNRYTDDYLFQRKLNPICVMPGARYSKLKKNDYLFYILAFLSARIIQRRFRKAFASNDVCPITQDPIKYPCWAKRLNSGHLVYYNLDRFVEYLVEYGDFRDPCSRESLSTVELRSIDQVYASTHSKLLANKNNLIRAYERPEFYRAKRERQEQIDLCNTHLTGIIVEIRNILNSPEHILEGNYVRQLWSHLNNAYMQDFSYFLRQLHNLSHDACFDTFVHILRMIFTTIKPQYVELMIVKSKLCRYIFRNMNIWYDQDVVQRIADDLTKIN